MRRRYRNGRDADLLPIAQCLPRLGGHVLSGDFPPSGGFALASGHPQSVNCPRPAALLAASCVMPCRPLCPGKYPLLSGSLEASGFPCKLEELLFLTRRRSPAAVNPQAFRWDVRMATRSEERRVGKECRSRWA